MQDTEVQRELLREPVEPAQALRLAITMELVQRNKLQFLSNQPALDVIAITPQQSFRNPNQRQIFQFPLGNKSTVSKLWSYLVSNSQG